MPLLSLQLVIVVPFVMPPELKETGSAESSQTQQPLTDCGLKYTAVYGVAVMGIY